MKGAPLTNPPEIVERIRRVILGGYGILTKSAAGKAPTCGYGKTGCCD